MKSIVTALAFVFSFTTLAAQDQPTPIENLDLQRYLGTWNQLATIPASFQNQCVADSTAEYSLEEDGLIKVINSCEVADGSREEAEGRARVNPEGEKNSQLQVTFVNVLGWQWALSGDYWVIYIDDKYETVLVGHPRLTNGWILSRKTTLDPTEYDFLASELKSQGYNICDFEMSTTTQQKFEKGFRLCDLVKN